VKGLTIIWEGGAADAHARHRLVFEMALVQCALGGALTLFVTGSAVMALRQASIKRDQFIPKLVGLSQLHVLLDELLTAGGRVVVCQSYMAGRGLSMEKLDPRIEAGGLVSVMQGLGEDRLVVI